MNQHEDLCPSLVKFYLSANDCTYCELIAKVRAYYSEGSHEASRQGSERQS
jgi:hypothetical protein